MVDKTLLVRCTSPMASRSYPTFHLSCTLLVASSMPSSTEINERNVGKFSASCLMIQTVVSIPLNPMMHITPFPPHSFLPSSPPSLALLSCPFLEVGTP